MASRVFRGAEGGGIAVPLNYRYAADEIKYCLEKADAEYLVFGPEFTGRIEEIFEQMPQINMWLYVGEDCPAFADSYDALLGNFEVDDPQVPLSDDDDAAIYFSSGTTGFPKAILHAHRSLMHSCRVEQNHHGQTHSDVFLCIPPLYHTGAKMHWFGSLISGSNARADTQDRIGGEVQHSMAAGALGAGYSRCDRPRRYKTFRL